MQVFPEIPLAPEGWISLRRTRVTGFALLQRTTGNVRASVTVARQPRRSYTIDGQVQRVDQGGFREGVGRLCSHTKRYRLR